jgi:hypothetical protein
MQQQQFCSERFAVKQNKTLLEGAYSPAAARQLVLHFWFKVCTSLSLLFFVYWQEN